MAILNSAVCLYIAGKTASIKEGLERASDLVDSGAALDTLNELVKFTNKVDLI